MLGTYPDVGEGTMPEVKELKGLWVKVVPSMTVVLSSTGRENWRLGVRRVWLATRTYHGHTWKPCEGVEMGGEASTNLLLAAEATAARETTKAE